MVRENSIFFLITLGGVSDEEVFIIFINKHASCPACHFTVRMLRQQIAS